MISYQRFQTLAGVLACCVFAAAPLSAQTVLYVDDDNCPGPGPGSLGDPFCRIQDAIGAAVDGDTVLVSPGTYTETINLIGKAMTLRSSDGPAVTILEATGAAGAAGANCPAVKLARGAGAGTVGAAFTRLRPKCSKRRATSNLRSAISSTI